jgi:predicted Zn-dependent protease
MTTRLPPRFRTAFAAGAAATLLLATVVLAPWAAPRAAAASVGEVREALERGHWHTAAELLGPALVAASPLEAEAHLLLAQARYLIGDLDGARGWLGTADALVGLPLPGAHLHLAGLLRADAGDPGGGADLLRGAFDRAPAYALALDWGRVAWQAGRWEEARAAFAAAATTPEGGRSPWPPLNEGRLLLLLGRPAEAVAAFERALDVYEANDPGGPLPPGPAYGEAWFRLGEAREALGARAEAEAAYRAAASVDPQHAGAAAALARFDAP